MNSQCFIDSNRGYYNENIYAIVAFDFYFFYFSQYFKYGRKIRLEKKKKQWPTAYYIEFIILYRFLDQY